MRHRYRSRQGGWFWKVLFLAAFVFFALGVVSIGGAMMKLVGNGPKAPSSASVLVVDLEGV
ncbi:MAG: hypothetical protein KDD25_07530, partial [Bdellovibrionales bacterium]|nr:hypothetical protein [Bdellovibrionales bacterium]